MEYGVLCKRADGQTVIVTVEADRPVDAIDQVRKHIALFYGPGDAAGRWLASKNPATIIEAGEVRPLALWDLAEPGPLAADRPGASRR
jgi:hypothetical protein